MSEPRRSSHPYGPVLPAPRGYGLARGVFGVSAGVVVLSVVLALTVPGAFGALVTTINDAVVRGLGWYYVLLVAGFVVFAIGIALSRLGEIKLGEDDEEPEYRLGSWFSMLFAAGMGIGLVFWGAAEPLSFFAGEGTIPPNSLGLDSEGRAQRAMGQTFLHWGLHAWAIYVVVGLAMAYAIHRRHRPVSIRWALEPILGHRTDTRLGDVVDVVAIVGTLFGVATSLGFGVNQIVAGLAHLGVLPDTPVTKIGIVVAVTAMATMSVVSGLDKGVKFLSNLNLGMAALLLVAVLILGPTLFLLREFVAGIGFYLQNFISLSFQTFPFFGAAGADWLSGWTAYYWGWWISWSPFVGIFIARISRGRTVREFIVGVLLVPTLVTIAWFTVMGGTAIAQMLLDGHDLRQADGTIDANTALFDMLNNLPLGGVLSGLAIIVVTIFFITSADSGAFVIDMVAHRGDPQPPRLTRAFWAISAGAIAGALLWAGARHGGDSSGMAALQALALLAAAPFSVVMILMAWSVLKELRYEVKLIERLESQVRRREFAAELGVSVHDQVLESLKEAELQGVDAELVDDVAPQPDPIPGVRARWRPGRRRA